MAETIKQKDPPVLLQSPAFARSVRRQTAIDRRTRPISARSVFLLVLGSIAVARRAIVATHVAAIEREMRTR